MRGKMRKKFTCPACMTEITAPVLDVKTIYSGFRRYRQCENCRVVFATVEKVDHITGWRSWNRGEEKTNERKTGGESSSEAN